MMPKRHALMSIGIGLLGWAWSRSPLTLLASLTVGVFVDLDHVVDYGWYAVSDEHRLVLPLHSYELVPALWWATRRPLGKRAAFSVTLSYLMHLLSDEVENCTRPGAYSFLWRAASGFRFECLSRDPSAAVQGRQEDLAKLGRLLLR